MSVEVEESPFLVLGRSPWGSGVGIMVYGVRSLRKSCIASAALGGADLKSWMLGLGSEVSCGVNDMNDGKSGEGDEPGARACALTRRDGVE
jgi:hypothetical protein